MIAIGSDHGGFALKQEIMAHLKARRLEYKDYGTYTEASCDYPVYAKAVAKASNCDTSPLASLSRCNDNLMAVQILRCGKCNRMVR